MTKTSYLKLTHGNEILSVCKIVDKKHTLSVHKNAISLYNEDLMSLINDGQFKKSNSKEFKSFIKKTKKRIKEIEEK